MNDQINSVTCPACGTTTRLEFPFLCTNVKRGIAVWYEPYHDPEIDKDIAQYAAHFGAKSFYAQAPRIKVWEDFKKTILKLEAIAGISPQTSISPELNMVMSNFVNSLRNANSTPRRRYPQWLSHLQSLTKRGMYATLPFIALLCFAVVSGGDEAINDIIGHPGQVIAALLLLTSGTFAFLTAVHLVISEYKPWKQRSKPFRLYCFLFVCWVVGVSVIVALFDPFEYGSYMDDDNYIHLLSLALVVPAFIGLAIYTYQRYVK